MKGLLLRQPSDKTQRVLDICHSHVVFVLDLLERHATREAAHDHGTGEAGATDKGLP